MARILIGTVPIIGHINPFIPLVRALVARGHSVRWYTGAKYRENIEAAGAQHLPYVHARDYDDADDGAFPGREKHEGVNKLKFDIKNQFVNNAPGQVRDLEAIMREQPADVLMVDPVFFGGLCYHELSGVPLVVLGVLPMPLSSRDTAPFGLGLAPSATPLGRARNHALNWLCQHVIFADVMRHWDDVRANVGLPPGPWIMDVPAAATLFLQPSIPGIEYPRSDLPGNVNFIGLMPPSAPDGWQAPAWWPELDGPRPVVHISQGTIANVRPELIAPAIEALASEDVLVVVSTGGRAPEQLGLASPPANVRVGTFLSYPELLPKTSVMLTNGGYGGVQIALAHGVPLAVAGTTEDKPEVAARVAWSGAGINMKTAAPTPAQVRATVRALLDDPRYRQRARELQAEYARYDAVTRSVALIERVLGPAALAEARSARYALS